MFAQALLQLVLSGAILAAPSGFPKTGNGMWYEAPGEVWVTDYLPIGNGFLAGKFDLTRSPQAGDRASIAFLSYDSGRDFSRVLAAEH